MKRNHHPDELKLLAYFDQELPADEAFPIKEHCETCPGCRQILADFGAVQEMIQTNIPQEEPQSLWSVVSEERDHAHRNSFSTSVVFGTFAACAAGIALGLLMGAPKGGMESSQGTEAWASADYLWSGTDSPSLLNVFSGEESQERSGES